MDLRADTRIPFPRDVVFAAYRDHLPDLLPYLPNVRRVDVKSREENGALVKLVNEWQGGGEIPTAVRALLGDSMLGWTDRATWNADTMGCEWRSETRAFGDALECAGRNEFLEDGPGRTLLQVRGTIAVDAKRLRGVPGFLATKVGRTLEEFLGSRIKTNLVETAKGLTKYLEQRK
jgi:hypothetical protein